MTRSFGLRLIAALALVAAIGACQKEKRVEGPPEPGDTAVATVDGETVWVSDVKRYAVDAALIGDGEPLDISSQLFREALDSVIDDKLLAAEARREGLDQSAVARRRLQAADDRILGALLIENKTQKAVTPAAIEQLYRELQRDNKPSEEIRVRQIVSASEVDAEATKRALSTPNVTFESLVLTRSVDPDTRFSGGDLGYLTVDVMPDSYAAALKNAKKGDIVGPFQSDDGWVLLEVEDRRPEQPIALEAARPQIVRFLTWAQIRDLMENLHDKAKVNILIPEPADASPPEPADAPPIAPGALPQAAPDTTSGPPAPKSEPEPK